MHGCAERKLRLSVTRNHCTDKQTHITKQKTGSLSEQMILIRFFLHQIEHLIVKSSVIKIKLYITNFDKESKQEHKSRFPPRYLNDKSSLVEFYCPK